MYGMVNSVSFPGIPCAEAMPNLVDLHRRDRPSHYNAGSKYPPRNPALLTKCFFNLLFFLTPPAFSICLIACGGVVSSPAPPSVTVSPSSAQPFTGTTVQFNASVQNAASSAVNWEVNSAPGGNGILGTIDSTGRYTAPATVPNPPTVTVTAVLQANPSTNGSSSVTIQGAAAILGPLILFPPLTSLTTSQTLQLQVTSAGVSNSQVNWGVDGFPNGSASTGTITANGLYTPPGAAGSHTITVQLKANPAVLGSALVGVTGLAGVLTWRNDNSRSGLNPQELALAPGTVTSSTFGKLFSCPLDGYAYAQPLLVTNLAIAGIGTRSVVFVATEKDSVFAFDADSNPCVQLWQTTLIPAGEQAVATPNLQIASDDIAPFVGITGTPVIDITTSTLYVVAKTLTPALNPIYHQRLYALDLTTGQPKIQPSGVQISTPGSVSPAFSSLLGNQRAALLLDNKAVYVAFASHHDQGDYHGWIMAYDAATLLQTSFLDVTPGGQQGGIWQSGGGPSADSNHNLFAVTGDGTFDVDRGGSNYGDSFLRMTATGGLAITGYFTPCNQASLESSGNDLGASAPLLLPDSSGPALHPNLVLGAGKNGSIYVADRDNLGGYNGGICPDVFPRPLQTLPLHEGPIFSTPLFWNNTILVAAGNANLEALPITAGVVAQVPLSSQSPETLGPLGATPMVSSNGANSAIVWLIDASGALATPNAPAVVRAYDANNLSNEIYNSAMVPARDTAGLAVKFTVPIEANGKVYVGTQSELDVYGLLAQ